jgi:hypothetical protein
MALQYISFDCFDFADSSSSESFEQSFFSLSAMEESALYFKKAYLWVKQKQ